MVVDQVSASERTHRPVRTCIGCRRAVTAAELFRVVVAGDSVGTHPSAPVVPDPRGRAPGRGAWLHPDPACVALATRRRAFGRALRVAGPVDVRAVEEFVARRTSENVSNVRSAPADGAAPPADRSRRR